MPRLRFPRLQHNAVALAALALTVALSATGCSKVFDNSYNGSTLTIGSAPYTQGSGKVVTETRPLAEFSSVSVENGITVFVRHGSTSSVDVSADDNLTTLIATDVAGDKLMIHVTGSLTTHSRIKLTVTSSKEIAAIAADNGSTVDSEDLTAPKLVVSVNNGSTLRAGGKTIALQVAVDNGSTGDLTNVEAKTADVTVDNGSTAILHVSDVVSGSCRNGSTLRVSGGANTTAVDKDSGSTVK